jgi:antirestriction protein ArdC
MKTDLYQKVTDQIIASLERGCRPWMKPWSGDHAAGRITRPLRGNGQPYQGINVIMLWMEAVEKGYDAPIWMTFKQALELGGAVRKGEHGSVVVYASTFTKKEEGESGEESERNIPFLKSYTAFNVEQIDGLPEHFYATIGPKLDPVQRIDRAETFFAATGADIRHGGGKAYYTIGGDYVQLPLFEAFRDAESYYATMAHELAHWTHHPSRLDRDFGRKRFGDGGYAMEELVAEMASAFTCADLDLEPEIREDHAAYIENWLQVLKNDKRAVFTAASYAQKAADFLSRVAA